MGAPLIIFPPRSTDMKSVPSKYYNKVGLLIHVDAPPLPASHNKPNGNCTNNGLIGHIQVFFFLAAM